MLHGSPGEVLLLHSYGRKKSRSVLRKLATSNVSHSQTVRTRHPAFVRAFSLRASRATLRSNFSSQNATLVFGLVVRRQLRCRCQKHPCTNTTLLSLGKTRSGVPGKSRRCKRKRKPSRWAELLTTISAREFFGPIRDIRADRTADTGASVQSLAAALDRLANEAS